LVNQHEKPNHIRLTDRFPDFHPTKMYEELLPQQCDSCFSLIFPA